VFIHFLLPFYGRVYLLEINAMQQYCLTVLIKLILDDICTKQITPGLVDIVKYEQRAL